MTTGARLMAALECANDAGGRCALWPSGDAHRVLRSKPRHGNVLRLRGQVGQRRTGSTGRDGSDPPVQGPGTGSGAGVFAHLPPPSWGRSRAIDPSRKGVGPMRPATLAIIGTALGAAAGHAFRAPFPGMGGSPVLDLIAYHDPGLHSTIRVWYYVAPGRRRGALRQPRASRSGESGFEPRAGGGRGRGTLPRLARLARGRRTLARDRRAAPSRRPARERAALLARHPRDGALHRRARRRRRRHRQDHRLHVPVRPAAPLVASRPGRTPGQRPGARGQGRLLSTACGGSSTTPGAAATTSRSGSTARCSGTRSTIRCSTPTRSPTASPPSSTSSSARAENRSGSKPIRISCAGSSNCIGSCRGAGSRCRTSTAARWMRNCSAARSARPASWPTGSARCGPPSRPRISPLTRNPSGNGAGSRCPARTRRLAGSTPHSGTGSRNSRSHTIRRRAGAERGASSVSGSRPSSGGICMTGRRSTPSSARRSSRASAVFLSLFDQPQVAGVFCPPPPELRMRIHTYV